ncbi:MAG: HAMP domain-containing sensor histidine kinase [Eubacteriales bacterium]|nr:HAMP domain-containing sensor histidine kinase [Eubacteriales bacterium]
MRNKLKYGLFTVNMTFLLTLNLFFIIALVLLVIALTGWLAIWAGWLDMSQLLTPENVMVAIYATAILIGISVVVMIQKVILDPMRSMVQAMQRLQSGDFTVRMNCRGWMRPLELREFTDAFNASAGELGNTELLRRDFINNFSHEFKTPITSLGGFADLLLEDNEMPEAERREYLEIISSESHRLASLASSVLALSRLEAQTILTDAALFPLAEQLRQSVMMIEQKWARKKNAVLTAQLPEDDEYDYYGNEALLKEVWVNLLDNAVKFSPDDGAVNVTIHREKDAITVTVTDHGPGMDEAIAARIFEQFYQGDTSHKTEGNGLGLAMVQKIVSLHGGTVTVDSSPGHGSAFTVRLPQRSPA